jgi:hypothetical protein
VSVSVEGWSRMGKVRLLYSARTHHQFSKALRDMHLFCVSFYDAPTISDGKVIGE